MCQTSAARSWRRSVTRNKNRTPIAVADARSALDEVELETPHLVGRRCIGRTPQPGGEPLAARNVAALSVRVELACSHVLDHALTQRSDSVAHREFRPE